jgi:2-hydroxychromene-2-carboxylate isomerase
MSAKASDKSVEFFYDFASPTAYIAWSRLPAILERTGGQVVYRPFFLGGVMQATGNRPPSTVEAKGRWMDADLKRYCAKYGVAYSRNTHFPMLTLMVQRAAVARVDQPGFEKYLATIFHAAWRDQKNIADKAVLAEVLAVAGYDPAAFFAETDDPANKEKLKANTDEAVARGVFGAPTFFVSTATGDEMHFGQDRLDWVEEALARG